MLFLSMQEVRKLHLPIKIQSISKVFVILEHVSMKNNRRPRWQEACFFLWQTSFGFRAWILQQLVLYSNSTSDLYEAKIFTRNNISILKNHLKNSVCFFLHLLFCKEAQNYKIDIFVEKFHPLGFFDGGGNPQVILSKTWKQGSSPISKNLDNFLIFFLKTLKFDMPYPLWLGIKEYLLY